MRNAQKTRETILETSFQEMHAHGFQGMRIDKVLKQSGLQKGALYHHFGSKVKLGYSVLEERIAPLMEEIWTKPISNMQDPIKEIPELLSSFNPPATMQQHGCPLNNLAQEMGSQDSGFQQRIVEVFEKWISALETTFEKARSKGKVREDIDSRAVAHYLVACIEGCLGMYKVSRSKEQWMACQSQIAIYLDSLKPESTSDR